jgi:hypothetical protein
MIDLKPLQGGLADISKGEQAIMAQPQPKAPEIQSAPLRGPHNMFAPGELYNPLPYLPVGNIGMAGGGDAGPGNTRITDPRG